jgi:hypothetical protein
MYQTPESIQSTRSKSLLRSDPLADLDQGSHIDRLHLIRGEYHPPEPRWQFIPIKDHVGTCIVPIGLTRGEMTSSCKGSMLLCIRSISFEVRYRFGKRIVRRLWMRLWFVRLDRSYKLLSSTQDKGWIHIPQERLPMKLISGLWTCDARTRGVTRIVQTK